MDLSDSRYNWYTTWQLTSLLFDSSYSQLFLLFLYGCNSFWFKIGLNNCFNPVLPNFLKIIVEAKFIELEVVSGSLGIAFTVIHRSFLHHWNSYGLYGLYVLCFMPSAKWESTLFRKLIIDLSADFLYACASKLFVNVRFLSLCVWCRQCKFLTMPFSFCRIVFSSTADKARDVPSTSLTTVSIFFFFFLCFSVLTYPAKSLSIGIYNVLQYVGSCGSN